MQNIESEVGAWVEEAVRRAASERQDARSNRSLSAAFVSQLAAALRERLDANACVLDRHSDISRDEFGLNELLFDVTAFTKAYIPSATHRRQLAYVQKPLWLVESELHPHDSRQVLRDFNKLVLGHSPNKLFVGAQSPRLQEFSEVQLRKVAEGCDGNVFVALVPMPMESWRENTSITYCRRLA